MWPAPVPSAECATHLVSDRSPCWWRQVARAAPARGLDHVTRASAGAGPGGADQGNPACNSDQWGRGSAHRATHLMDMWSGERRPNPGPGGWWGDTGDRGGGNGGLSNPGWNLTAGGYRPPPKFPGKPRNWNPWNWLWKCGGIISPGIWVAPVRCCCIFSKFSFWYCITSSGLWARSLGSLESSSPCWS